VIQKHLEDYVLLLQNKINQFKRELITQALSCPTSFESIQIIDQRLKEFVRLHHIDLLRTVSYQINKLKNKIYEKQLLQQLSAYNLTTEQVSILTK